MVGVWSEITGNVHLFRILFLRDFDQRIAILHCYVQRNGTLLRACR